MTPPSIRPSVPGQAHELALPHREVLPALADLVVQALGQGGHVGLEVRVLQGRPDLRVRVLAARVQVEAQVAGEQDGVLGGKLGGFATVAEKID